MVVVPFSEVRFVEIEEHLCEDVKKKEDKTEVQELALFF